MLSTSSELWDDDEGGSLPDDSRRPPSTEHGGIEEDVERLIEIAAQLFTAIERQIHQIEEELVIACGEHVRTFAQTIFKERLIQCSESLELSIKEIGLQLEQRAREHIANYGPRDNTFI